MVALFAALVFAFFTLGNSAHAQLIPTPESQSNLILDPTYPGPGTEVLVRLDAYSVNTTGAEIRWFIDDVESVGDRNERSITVPLHNSGR